MIHWYWLIFAAMFGATFGVFVTGAREINREHQKESN